MAVNAQGSYLSDVYDQLSGLVSTRGIHVSTFVDIMTEYLPEMGVGFDPEAYFAYSYGPIYASDDDKTGSMFTIYVPKIPMRAVAFKDDIGFCYIFMNYEFVEFREGGRNNSGEAIVRRAVTCCDDEYYLSSECRVYMKPIDGFEIAYREIDYDNIGDSRADVAISRNLASLRKYFPDIFSECGVIKKSSRTYFTVDAGEDYVNGEENEDDDKDDKDDEKEVLGIGLFENDHVFVDLEGDTYYEVPVINDDQNDYERDYDYQDDYERDYDEWDNYEEERCIEEEYYG